MRESPKACLSHLVLLQGTDWAMSNTTLFTLPDKKNVSNMINTLKYTQQCIEPEIGVVIPVSGEGLRFITNKLAVHCEAGT